MFYLTAVEVKGIQNYIFNSNRLQENIGASYLVEQATDNWPREVLSTMQIDVTNQPLEQGNTAAEILYSGGGNCFVIFRERETAKTFTRSLSYKALREAPGLRINIATVEFDWNTTTIAKAIGEVKKKLEQKASSRAGTHVFRGIGINGVCVSTGMPAVARDDQQLISAEVKAKRQAAEKANAVLKQQIPIEADHNRYQYPSDLDMIARGKHDSSLIAVVHADGDGIGNFFKSVVSKFNSPAENRACIARLRDMSDKLKLASRKALIQTTQSLLTTISHDRDLTHKFLNTDPEAQQQNLPFRPIVFGGDDVTFVCAGEFGVSLTVEYMKAFEAHTFQEFGQAFTSCAGVAIVKSRYPFARAYALAEDLTANAKKGKKGSSPEHKSAFIDWHFAVTGITGDIEDIRKREYCVKDRSLTLRPLPLSGATPNEVDWPSFAKLLHELHSEFQESRNKLKGLREVLRGPEEAFKLYIGTYELGLPAFMGSKDAWMNNQSRYFDAIELLDDYVAISVSAAKEGAS
jgi:hypothetical protein